jgi:hypothetical protein
LQKKQVECRQIQKADNVLTIIGSPSGLEQGGVIKDWQVASQQEMTCVIEVDLNMRWTL